MGDGLHAMEPSMITINHECHLNIGTWWSFVIEHNMQSLLMAHEVISSATLTQAVLIISSYVILATNWVDSLLIILLKNTVAIQICLSFIVPWIGTCSCPALFLIGWDVRGPSTCVVWPCHASWQTARTMVAMERLKQHLQGSWKMAASRQDEEVKCYSCVSRLGVS